MKTKIKPQDYILDIGKLLDSPKFIKQMNDMTIRHFGDWGEKYKYVRYNKKRRTIDVDNGNGGIYDVDLDRCKTAGECLDWVHQLHGKIWFDAEREKEFIDMLFRLIPSKLWSGGGHE